MRKSKILDVFVFSIVLSLKWRMVFMQGAPCAKDAKAGPDNPEKLNKDVDPDKATGYLVYSDTYVIKCCGTVRAWKLSIDKGTDVDLQIWRPKDNKNTKFELVGSNTYKVNKKDKKGGIVEYDVSAKDMISVEEKDVIGWYSKGDPVIEYGDDKDGDGIWKLASDSSNKVGDVVDFSKGEKQSKRSYGVQIELNPNNPPKLDLLLATSVPMHAEIGTVAYTVHVLDDDPDDVKGLKLEMLTTNEFFQFDPKTGILSVATDITVPKEGKTYTFDFKVTDHCGASDTGTLTVNVDYVERQTYPTKSSQKETTAKKSDPPTTTAKATDKDKKDDNAADSGNNPDDSPDDKDGADNGDGGDDDDKGNGKDKGKKKDEPESTTTSTTFLPEYYEDFTEETNITATGNRRRSPDIGLIAGIILGAVALLVLVGAAVAIILNKKAKAKAKVASKDVEKRAREAYAKSKGKPTPKNSVKPSGKTNSDDKEKSSSKDSEKKPDKENKGKEKSPQKTDDKSSHKSHSNDHKKPSDKPTDKKSTQSRPDSKPTMNGKSSK